MKIVELSTKGIGHAAARKIRPVTGAYYYAICHGDDVHGGWEVRYPLTVEEYPCGENSPQQILLDGEYELIDLKRADSDGNPQYLIVPGVEDGATIVLWRLSPGYRGGAAFQLDGRTECIGLGREVHDDAGHTWWAYCPIIFVAGPCTLSWRRHGTCAARRPSGRRRSTARPGPSPRLMPDGTFRKAAQDNRARSDPGVHELRVAFYGRIKR